VSDVSFQFAICNEVIAAASAGGLPGSTASLAVRKKDFERQCQWARLVGFKGLEVAPFTLADNPLSLTRQDLHAYREIADRYEVSISGLHWLMVAPAGLSLVTRDESTRSRSTQSLVTFVEMAHELGASYLVHGSPKQRSPQDNQTIDEAKALLLEGLLPAFERANSLGLSYCLEPLSSHETSVINRVAEAVEFLRINQTDYGFTMIDTSAAGLMETETVDSLIQKWLPTGRIGHIQLNDPNRKAPGQGSMDFEPILNALLNQKFTGWLALEPFIYEPNGPTCAETALRYLQAIERKIRTY
jgi:D-psicose/D-tagatose/L-ribulose 3-epimerase